MPTSSCSIVFHATIDEELFLFGGSGIPPTTTDLSLPPKVNKLLVGLTKTVEPQRGLFIDDEVPDIPRARIFDPQKHSFNPLEGMDYKKARQLAEALYTIYPQGADTLTVRGGKRGLAKMLMKADRLDKIETRLWHKAEAHERDKKNNEPLSPVEAEVLGVVSDILLSPVLKRIFGKAPHHFLFDPDDTILARINRAELGEFDALVLGLFLIGQFKGQVIVPDGGFYLRDSHVSLIRENRLVAGVNTLSELPVKLRGNLLLIEDKEARGALYDDAVELAKLAGLRPDPLHDDNPYNRFIAEAMA